MIVEVLILFRHLVTNPLIAAVTHLSATQLRKVHSNFLAQQANT